MRTTSSTRPARSSIKRRLRRFSTSGGAMDELNPPRSTSSSSTTQLRTGRRTGKPAASKWRLHALNSQFRDWKTTFDFSDPKDETRNRLEEPLHVVLTKHRRAVTGLPCITGIAGRRQMPNLREQVAGNAQCHRGG